VPNRYLCAAWLTLAVAGPSMAQESPPPTVGTVLDLNTLLVSPVQATGEGLAQDAERVTSMLERRLGETNVTLTIADVPAFEAQEYSAETYVLACPPGEYSGCAQVVGQRAPSDWVVGGTLARAPEELLAGDDALLLTVYFIDVRGSREVVNFGVVVGGQTDDTEVITKIGGVYDRIVQGALDEVDVRGEIRDPKVEAALKRRREEIAAASLQELESELGDLIITPPSEITPERVTRESLREFDDRDDVAPWIRLEMTESQYLRYLNTGLDLDVYRRRIRGRFGQILLRVGVGGGTGPFGLHHEGRNAVGFDGAEFVVMQVDQFQEVRQASNSSLSAEVGFGVASFLDLGFAVARREARYTYRFDQDEVGDPSFLEEPVGDRGSSTQYGVLATVAPLPLRQLRPTATLGLSYWTGSAIAGQDPYVSLDGPKMVLLQAGPGGELSAGRYLNLSLRALLDLPLGGTFVDSASRGTPGSLQDLETPTGKYGPGFLVQGGLQFRLGLLRDPGGEVQSLFEEEEEGL
jgi:hypothetical protein